MKFLCPRWLSFCCFVAQTARHLIQLCNLFQIGLNFWIFLSGLTWAMLLSNIDRNDDQSYQSVTHVVIKTEIMSQNAAKWWLSSSAATGTLRVNCFTLLNGQRRRCLSNCSLPLSAPLKQVEQRAHIWKLVIWETSVMLYSVLIQLRRILPDLWERLVCSVGAG